MNKYSEPEAGDIVKVTPEEVASLISSPPPVTKKPKRFALVPAPFDNVMTYEEAIAKADQQILDGKAKQMYVLEIVGVIEPITRMVDFTETN